MPPFLKSSPITKDSVSYPCNIKESNSGGDFFFKMFYKLSDSLELLQIMDLGERDQRGIAGRIAK